MWRCGVYELPLYKRFSFFVCSKCVYSCYYWYFHLSETCQPIRLKQPNKKKKKKKMRKKNQSQRGEILTFSLALHLLKTLNPSGYLFVICSKFLLYTTLLHTNTPKKNQSNALAIQIFSIILTIGLTMLTVVVFFSLRFHFGSIQRWHKAYLLSFVRIYRYDFTRRLMFVPLQFANIKMPHV